MPVPVYLTVEEVIERYRDQISEGTLRNWRSMRIGPSFIKIGKAVLYPADELEKWDRSNLIICRPSRSLLSTVLPAEEA
ncbi:helix-turn-helix domain-containing protein [uncultured Nitratireductor sp.]|uniref:helix-turn-helix domain-containing protein n=1 Tax=uncultured Nitratireductor sp. TaxID=520953 RepID=UPI0025F7333B|nr:helix-turn-helix domain-containing protein [uncultured Nitratireductor sp.]